MTIAAALRGTLAEKTGQPVVAIRLEFIDWEG